jgi:hypothetical protein
MNRRSLLLVSFLGLLFAAPAWSVDTTRYPLTILDTTCTDSNDTPAAATPPSAALDGPLPAAIVQTSGSADGYCDHDSYIQKAKVEADTFFGPFTINDRTIKCIFWRIDADDASSPFTWSGQYVTPIPHDVNLKVVDGGAIYGGAGTGDKVLMIGANPDYVVDGTFITDELPVPLFTPFYLKIKLNSAPDITADSSIGLCQ